MMVRIGSDMETFLLLVGGGWVLMVLMVLIVLIVLGDSNFLFPRALIVERDGFVF